MEHYATYSPEDDKIRIYPASRLPKEEYQKLKSVGYGWAPKQECFYAVWSPKREDAALEMCGEIGDEDKSLVDRAEERAERFSDYSSKKEREANSTAESVKSLADGIPLGQPILVGHHSEKRARRDAEKIENGMRKAVKMWETADYWKYRAAGALRHAKYKERPDVRVRRIKKLEAEIRKYTAEYTPCSSTTLNQRRFHCPVCKKCLCDEHPEAKEEVSHVLCGQGRAKHWVPSENIERIKKSYARSIAHIENRLVYERTMLNDQGASDLLEPKPRPKQLPLLNYKKDGGFTVSNRWSRGSTCRYPQVVMELKDYRTIPSDYRGTITVDGTHRVRIAIGCFIPDIKAQVKLISDDCEKWNVKHKYFAVFLSDSKIHTPPAQETPPETTVESSETEASPEEPLRALESKSEVPTKIRYENEKTEQMSLFSEPIRGKSADIVIIDDPMGNMDETYTTIPSGTRAGKTTMFEKFKEQLKSGIKVETAPQLFPTPPDIAERMVLMADIKPGMKVLEPSAGTGNIIRELVNEGGCSITGVEINGRLCELLRETFRFRQLVNENFLSCNGNLGVFDRVVMNPPFEKAADIKHIEHALKFLKPGGVLVSLCANGPRQNDKLKPLADEWEELPQGSFKGSGTMVNVALLKITKGE